MEILSYPVGRLIGLFPVIVELDPVTQNAELLIDGRPACTITARAPACTVDLGADPVIHSIDQPGNSTRAPSTRGVLVLAPQRAN